MKNKFLKRLLWVSLITSIVTPSFAADNAFGSLVSDNKTPLQQQIAVTEAIDVSVHPLVQGPVLSNILIGVMISPSMKIAYIQTISGEEYFVRVGDKLGNSNGSISDINPNGIEVEEDSEFISLPVRNKSASSGTENE